MLKEIIEDVKDFFTDYFEIYDKVAKIPVCKISEVIDNLENVIVRIGEKTVYSCSEFAIIVLKMQCENILQTANNSSDLETCSVNVKDMTENIDNLLIAVS